MQIGAMNHPAKDAIAEIRWIGEHGFDFVDFTFEPPAADPDEVDTAAVKWALADHSLDVVAHTAWYLPLGFPFASVRQAATGEFRRSLQAAHRIGARVMNTHFRKPPRFFSHEETITWHVEVLTPLCKEADDLGITIVLEHVPSGGSDQLETVEAILEKVPLLRFHLDSGHAKLERSDDRFEEYLERLGHKLLHVHLSDNDGTADQHLPLGACPGSATDWLRHIQRLKASGYDGTITLEVFSPHKEYLLLSRGFLRKWWDEA